MVPQLDDPAIPLWVTEGVKKADAAAVRGLCCVALPGVWSWRGTNAKGGKVAVPDWHDVALNGRRVILAFDGDVVRKRSVRTALNQLAGYLASKDAHTEYLHLPDDDATKTGLDDYLAAGHDVDELWKLVRPEPPAIVDPEPNAETSGNAGAPTATPEPVDRRKVDAVPVPLPQALATFRSWLHLDDVAPVLAVAAVVVANLAEGDPVWLLVVGPPSGGKTEILLSCSPLPCVVPTATITEAALLSGTSSKERASDATGGLLRQVGGFGILLAKDFTSVLSQNKDTARQAMAALREVYDGAWHRPVGTDGGRMLRWLGKCGFIGGVTPSYDRYGAIVNALGDRYLLLRMPDVDGEAQAHSALAQAEHEKPMRAALAEAMTGLVATADLTQVHAPLSAAENTALVELAMFTARARTTVERDGYSGELLVMPQPEGPARLVKAMRRTYGALGALSVDDDTRWSVLSRIALDCAPALRVPLMRALLAATTPSRTSELSQAAGLVTKTAHRQLDDLALLGIVEHTKLSAADNSPSLWSASTWLRDYWPQKVGQTYPTHSPITIKGASSSNGAASGTPRMSLSHSDDPPPHQPPPAPLSKTGTCGRCQQPRTPLVALDTKGRDVCADCADDRTTTSPVGALP